MNSKNLATRGKLLAGFVTLLFLGLSASAQSLTLAEVQTIIAQAVSQAVALNQKVTVSVTDNEGHLLGTFAMTDARDMTLVRSVGRAGQGLEGARLPEGLDRHADRLDGAGGLRAAQGLLAELPAGPREDQHRDDLASSSAGLSRPRAPASGSRCGSDGRGRRAPPP